MATRKRVELSEVVSHFEMLEDSRSSINRHHPLVSVVTISLMAVLSGADGPTAIRQWAKAKSDFLLSALDLPKGIPSKDVFRRVMMALDPHAFQACFMSWLNSLQQASNPNPQQRQTMAVDGKCLRRSHDRAKGLGPLHLVSVWLSDVGLTLAQTATDTKSNEITAIPEVLKLVDMKGAIISIDAMGTQTAIAEQIIEGGGDYVLALKANQGGLHKAVIEYVDEHVNDDFARLKTRSHVDAETKHGREETRTYLQFSVPPELEGRSRWKGLRTIGLVIHESQRGGKDTLEVRYFISSLRLGIKQFARSVRNHWGIENTCHWSLDMTYREDEQRTRHRRLAENLAWLRRFTLSLIKQAPGKQSLIMKRRMCGWNDDFMIQVLTGQTT